MGISINTNVAATRAGMFLKTNHANLQKSLDRLSSGRRITEPADDAGTSGLDETRAYRQSSSRGCQQYFECDLTNTNSGQCIEVGWRHSQSNRENWQQCIPM